MSRSEMQSAPLHGAPASSLIRSDAQTCDGLLAEREATSTGLAPEHAGSLLDVACGVLGELDLEVVVDRVLEAARVLTGAQFAALGVLDSSGTELERFITSGIDEDAPLGHPPMHSFLGVPIFAGGVPFGSLYLTEKAEGLQFTDTDQESVTVLARFAGVAIDHARRYTGASTRGDELARTVAALEATTEIARAVGGETDVEVILQMVAKRGRALVGARALLIELVSGAELVVSAAAGDQPEGLVGSRIVLADTVASAALRASRTQRLEVDLNRARFAQHGAGQLGVSAEAGLVVPLILHNHAYGVLIALDRLHDGPAFTAQDQRLLEAFAASAATAVATAQSASSELQRERLAAAEEESRRWARELHDETLQSLAGLRLQLSAAQRAGGVQVLETAVGAAIQQLGDGITNLRSLLTDLRPAALDELGLEAALDALTERASRQGLEIDSSINLSYEQGRESTRPTAELESAIYRIAQEGLTNATKNGHAKRAVIEIDESQTTITLTVRDDGDGFDPIASTSGLGLRGIRERVQLLHGTIQITSSPGDGTTLTASFPVQRHCTQHAAA